MRRNKLLKLSAIILSLSVTACNGFDGFPGFNNPFTKPEEGEENDDEHKEGENPEIKNDEVRHWYVNSDGSITGLEVHRFVKSEESTGETTVYYCSTCGYKKEELGLDDHTHVFRLDEKGNEEVIGIDTGDCLNHGHYSKYCTICNKVIVFEGEFGSHDYVVEAQSSTGGTCSEPGIELLKCNLCGNLETRFTPLGDHVYKDPVTGDHNISWRAQPSCYIAGVGTQKCIYCGHEEEVVKKLDHDFESIRIHHDSDMKILFSEEKCKFCGLVQCSSTSFELTERSLETTVSNEDGGVAPYGNFVGTDVEFDSLGYVFPWGKNEYNPNQEGDFVEFTIYLTDEEASKYKYSKLYIEVEMNKGLISDRKDFFLIEDPTRETKFGRYIKDENGHKAGDFIYDQRYLFYVNDEPIAFDKTIKNVRYYENEDNQTEEVVVPCTFSLKTGYNTIKLVNASLYRNYFYKFSVRGEESYEEHQKNNSHTFFSKTLVNPYVDDRGHTDSVPYTIEACKCGAVKFTIDVSVDKSKYLTRGGTLKAPTNNIYHSSIFTFDIYSGFYEGTLYAYGGIEDMRNLDYSFYSGTIEGQIYEVLPNGATNTRLIVDDKERVLPKHRYNAYGLSYGLLSNLNYGTTSEIEFFNAAMIPLCDLGIGYHTKIELAALNSFGINYIDLVFIGRPSTVNTRY